MRDSLSIGSNKDSETTLGPGLKQNAENAVRVAYLTAFIVGATSDHARPSHSNPMAVLLAETIACGLIAQRDQLKNIQSSGNALDNPDREKVEAIGKMVAMGKDTVVAYPLGTWALTLLFAPTDSGYFQNLESWVGRFEGNTDLFKAVLREKLPEA
jgi:hypothetical protein